MLSMYASWCTYDGVSMSFYMEFPCSFHLVNLFVLLMQGPARNLHGISMEPPWKLHQKLHSSTRWHRRAEQKKETCWDCFCWKITSNLHQNSMEPPWKTPSKLHSSTRMAQKSWAKKETCWDCFCWKLHQTSIKTPWNLHGICMSQTIGTSKGKSAKNLHQNSMEPTSNSHENDYESFAKTILEAISSFLP